jgi:uncharacterized membrane protein YfcA
MVVGLPIIDGALLVLAATVLVAGVARGLAGFGTGMIVVPVAGALYGPQAAVVIIVIMDLLPAIPLTVPVLKIVRWREVLAVFAGMTVSVPLGVWILRVGDPTVLRVVIAVAILLCATALWRGWSYKGERTQAKSFAVGGIAGALSGIAQIPAPPVLVYWLSSPLPAAIIRANLLTLFVLATCVNFGSLFWQGLFTRDVVSIGLSITPVYFAGILVGWAFYGRTSEHRYRQITLALVVLSAVLSMPWSAILPV